MEDDDELTAALEDDAPDEAQDSEIDRLDPEADTFTLACGIEVRVLPLRTRQLFKVLRIITHGAGQALQNAGLDFSEPGEVFLQKLVSIVLFSIPDAEQETIDFLQSMVEPAGMIDKPPMSLTKAERAENIRLQTELNIEIWNPDPADTIDLVQLVFQREAKDIQALGKKVRSLIELASKTGQLKAAPSSPTAKSSVSSPASSTRSRTSTAGRTSKSSTSRSAASGKSAARSSSGSSRKNAPAARLSSGRPRSSPRTWGPRRRLSR